MMFIFMIIKNQKLVEMKISLLWVCLKYLLVTEKKDKQRQPEYTSLNTYICLRTMNEFSA